MSFAQTLLAKVKSKPDMEGVMQYVVISFISGKLSVDLKI